MTIIDRRGLVDDGSPNLNVAGDVSFAGNVAMPKAQITVANTGSLAAYPSSQLNAGTIAFVNGSGGSYWAWYPTGTTIPDNATEVLGSGGNWVLTTTGPLLLPGYLATLWVSIAGDDVTGSGTALLPYQTLAHALSTIKDASSTKRYAILVGPGSFPDPFQIKPWVAIVGVDGGSNGAGSNGASLTEITAPVDTCGLDPSFGSSGFAISWYSMLGFANHQTWDQAIQAPGCQPQLIFKCCSFVAGAFFNGTGTVGFDNVLWEMCLSYGGVHVKGWQFLFCRHSEFLGGEVVIEAGPPGAIEDTTMLAQATGVGNNQYPTNVTILWTSGSSPPNVKAVGEFSSTNLAGNLTMNGVHTRYEANIEAMPGIAYTVLLVSGATSLVLQSAASSLAYQPVSGSSWNGVLPTSVSNALDRIATKIGPIG